METISISKMRFPFGGIVWNSQGIIQWKKRLSNWMEVWTFEKLGYLAVWYDLFVSRTPQLWARAALNSFKGADRCTTCTKLTPQSPQECCFLFSDKTSKTVGQVWICREVKVVAENQMYSVIMTLRALGDILRYLWWLPVVVFIIVLLLQVVWFPSNHALAGPVSTLKVQGWVNELRVTDTPR
jgi:hypothetical protein